VRLDASTIETVWYPSKVTSLQLMGWTIAGQGECQGRAYWFMAPPEPTLIERLRGFANLRGPYDPLRYDLLEAASELERYARVGDCLRKRKKGMSPTHGGFWHGWVSSLIDMIDAKGKGE